MPELLQSLGPVCVVGVIVVLAVLVVCVMVSKDDRPKPPGVR